MTNQNLENLLWIPAILNVACVATYIASDLVRGYLIKRQSKKLEAETARTNVDSRYINEGITEYK